MHRFEPPPLPGDSRPSQEPGDPYAAPTPGAETPQPYASGSHTAPYGYGYGAAPQGQWGAPAYYTHPKGTTVLVLGILSVVAVPLLGPFAWVMGRSSLREADATGQQVTNRSSLTAGMVLGIIGTLMLVLGVVLVVMLFGSIFLFAVDAG